VPLYFSGDLSMRQVYHIDRLKVNAGRRRFRAGDDVDEHADADLVR